MSTRDDAVVDRDQAASQQRNQSVDPAVIRGEDTGGQVLSAPLMQGEEFRFGSPSANDQQRAEVIAIEGLSVQGAVENHLRTYPPPFCRIGDLSGWLTTSSDRVFDEIPMTVCRVGVNQISHPGTGGQRDECGHKRGMLLRMNEYPPRRHAGLTSIHRDRCPDASCGDHWIRIIKDNRGITAGKFKCGGEQSAGRGFRDQGADGRRASEHNMIEVRRLKQLAPNVPARRHHNHIFLVKTGRAGKFEKPTLRLW